jgi:hypothetical protein
LDRRIKLHQSLKEELNPNMKSLLDASSGLKGALLHLQMAVAGQTDVNAAVFQPLSACPLDDVFVNYVVSRGLIGQRGPFEEASKVDGCKDTDAKLPYNFPDLDVMNARLPRLELALKHSKSLKAQCRDPLNMQQTMAPKRAKLSDGKWTMSKAFANANAPLGRVQSYGSGMDTMETDEKLNVFDADCTWRSLDQEMCIHSMNGNYAVTGARQAKLDKDDLTEPEMEHAYKVRWLPVGKHAHDLAVASIYEHLIARCKELCEDDACVHEKDSLKELAFNLKLDQLVPLFRLIKANTLNDNVPEKMSAANNLVTRPWAYTTSSGLMAPIGNAVAEHSQMNICTHESAEHALFRKEMTMRAQTSKSNIGPSLYVAPDVEHVPVLNAIPEAGASTGAGANTTPSLFFRASRLIANSRVHEDGFRRGNLRDIIEMGIDSCDIFLGSAIRNVDAFLGNEAQDDASRTASTSGIDRRDGLWTEMLRSIAISGDRLWAFVRFYSGVLGDDVNAIITQADQQMLEATKSLQEQRLAITKRVSDAQAKLVETLVSGMIRESKLVLDKSNIDGMDELVVIDAEAKKQMRELASGESGRPFFEANVALRNMANDDRNASKTTLGEILNSVAKVGEQLQHSLEEQLEQPGFAGASLTELSQPSNSYFVSFRTDAIAAVRTAHEKLNVELSLAGSGRRISLWELVEGGCEPLTHRFAELCGHVLVQTRSATGSSALYVSQWAISTNAMQARIALQRCTNMAIAYIRSVNVPDPLNETTDAMEILVNRTTHIANASKVMEQHVVMTRVARPRNPLEARIHSTRWGHYGFA